MSSIKYATLLSCSLYAYTCVRQVQDLQSRVAELTQQNSHLLTRYGDRRSMEIDVLPITKGRQDESDVSAQATAKRVAAPVMSNFDHVRRNIRVHSRGIFEPPTSEQDRSFPDPALEARDPPPQADYVHISRSYLDSIHEAYPVLHWPTFEAEVEHIYTLRSFQGASREWIGLFFAVLACGCLNVLPTTVPSGSNDGANFYEIASQTLTPWPQQPTIVHVRLLLLLSICATENGMTSEGSMWLASAIRVAQGLALHSEDDALSFVESELRRRLWWALYVRDRLVTAL
jgi:hypothetical protein